MKSITAQENILIVDDTPDNLRLLCGMLEKDGYEVRPVTNGRLALTASAALLPDLILLDITMPGIDGFEVCRLLKAERETANIPVIFISALNATDDKVKAFDCGGVDYITKPFQGEEVLARVRTHLTISRLQRKLEAATLVAEKATREKELLLVEVHHRIKNNMGVIMSLLSLQAGLIGNSAAVSALKDARSRIHSMMILYDKLYRSADFGAISIKIYLDALLPEIMGLFPGNESVLLEKSIEDFSLGSKILSTVGIIVNELMTNIMKYAFGGRESGRIRIGATLRGTRAALSLEDDGVGLPQSFSLDNPSGFGLQLVKILMEQLSGTIRVEQGSGTKFILEFEV